MRLKIAAILLLALPLFAQTPPPVPGCEFRDIPEKDWGDRAFRNPPEDQSVNGVLQTTLAVKYTDPKTTSIGGCGVRLRSYNGQLVGPTLRIRPGDVMDIQLDNQLPAESPDEIANQLAQEYDNGFIETRPHTFNTTNLHTHGLHVSPVGNSDNVLLAITPRTSFPYEIRVPANHPPGTFWYHAHAHGSTAVQVGSGMEGALIIADDPKKIPSSLLAADANEKIMVIQTTLYDAQGEVKDITAFFPNPTPPDACEKQLPSCTWSGSKRKVTINGQITPIIHARPGEVQRWRFIDAAFRESFNLRLTGHVLNEIALDGLYLGRIDVWGAGYANVPDDKFPINQTVELQPGYRSDVLVQASRTPGTYYLVDLPTPAGNPPPSDPTPCPGAQALRAAPSAAHPAGAPRPLMQAVNAAPTPRATIAGSVRTSLLGIPEPQDVIAVLVVDDAPPVDMKLPTNAEMAKLAPFPGVNLQAQAVGVQQATFKIGSPYTPPDPNNPNDPINNKTYFQINFRAFNPSHIRTVTLNTTDMWSLTTVGDPPCSPLSGGGIPPLPHVFHIHVNPFQTLRLDPQGKPEMVWKDTLLVPAAAQLQAYTQYLDYIGQFVMHCHILDHEDLGMMEIVEVVEDRPAAALPAHGGH